MKIIGSSCSERDTSTSDTEVWQPSFFVEVHVCQDRWSGLKTRGQMSPTSPCSEYCRREVTHMHTVSLHPRIISLPQERIEVWENVPKRERKEGRSTHLRSRCSFMDFLLTLSFFYCSWSCSADNILSYFFHGYFSFLQEVYMLPSFFIAPPCSS